MILVQTEQKNYVNENQIPPFIFRKGDMVFINTKIINKTRSNVKLDYRNIGPYKVEEILSSLIYKLKLLVLIRI